MSQRQSKRSETRNILRLGSDFLATHDNTRDRHFISIVLESIKNDIQSNIDYSLNNTDFELEVARSTELDQSEFERFARMDQHTSNDPHFFS